MKSSFSLALVSVCFLLGAAAGCLVAMMVADSGELIVFFGDMVEGAKQGALQNSFWRVLLPNLLWPALILLFSFSPFGIAGIPVCMFAKGFLISYSVSAIFRAFGLNGIWLALTSVGLPNLIYIPFLVIVSMLGLKIASGAQTSKRVFYFHAITLCVFVGLAAFQTFLQPKIVTWLMIKTTLTAFLT